MTPHRLCLVILVLSLAVLGSVWGLQHWDGLIPCELCLKERWAWYAAIPLAAGCALAGPRLPMPSVPTLFAALFLASAGIAFYHVGVEQGLFSGPDACTAPKLKGASSEELLAEILNTPAVLCNEVQAYFLGLSLAAWNLVASLGLVGLALWTWRGVHREGTQ